MLVKTDDLFGTTDVALAGPNQAYGVVAQANFLPIATSVIEVDGTTDILAVRTDDITGDMTTGFDAQVNQVMNWDTATNILPVANTWLFDPFLLGSAALTVHELTVRTNDFRGTVSPNWTIDTPGFLGYVADSGLPTTAGGLVIDAVSGEVRSVTPISPTNTLEGTLASAFTIDLASNAWTSVPANGILPPTGSIIGIPASSKRSPR